MAVENGDIAMARFLLENGADVNAPGGVWETPLGTAAHAGNVPMARLLLDSGADPDKGNPIITAADAGRLEVVKLLLDAGADPSLPNRQGWTALDVARSHKQGEIRALLLKHLKKDVEPAAGPPSQ